MRCQARTSFLRPSLPGRVGEEGVSFFDTAGDVLVRHARAFRGHPRILTKAWMAGTSPRLSGLILVDVAHGVDSSVF
jgi:hypothetical protein